MCMKDSYRQIMLSFSCFMKEDTAILLHINAKDCAPVGVRYHKSCSYQYSRFFNMPTATVTGTARVPTVFLPYG